MINKKVSSRTVLTPKQKMFCDEYLIDLNGAQAAIRAGYSVKTAKEIAFENLTKPHMLDYIQSAMKKRANKLERSAEDVLRDIEEVKKDSMQRISDRDGNMIMNNAAAALKALELEGKHRKMFTDKVEHSGGIEVTRIERVIVKP